MSRTPLHGLMGLVLLAHFAAFADEVVPAVPIIQLNLPQGASVSAVLMRRPIQASVVGTGPALFGYYLTWMEGLRPAQMALPTEDGRDLVAVAARFAVRDRRYQVLRRTDGYSSGTPGFIEVTAVHNERGTLRLARYRDANRPPEDLLAAEYRDADPLIAGVRYSFQDAARAPGPFGMPDPHGRILLDAQGRVEYVGYNKPIAVFEIDGTGRRRMGGDFPSIQDALAAARGPKPDLSKLRFAADFGPQFSGIATAGTKRENQLIPFIPIGVVRNPLSNEELVAVVPLDLLQAYKAGTLSRDRILLLPPTVLRFVPGNGDWNAIVDDYLALRKTGRDVERIFVANGRGSLGAMATGGGGTLNSATMFLGESRREVERGIDGLRKDLPPSILDFDPADPSRRPPSSSCSEDLGNYS